MELQQLFRFFIQGIMFFGFVVITINAIKKLDAETTNISVDYEVDLFPLPSLTICPIMVNLKTYPMFGTFSVNKTIMDFYQQVKSVKESLISFNFFEGTQYYEG